MLSVGEGPLAGQLLRALAYVQALVARLNGPLQQSFDRSYSPKASVKIAHLQSTPNVAFIRQQFLASESPVIYLPGWLAHSPIAALVSCCKHKRGHTLLAQTETHRYVCLHCINARDIMLNLAKCPTL